MENDSAWTGIIEDNSEPINTFDFYFEEFIFTDGKANIFYNATSIF